MKVASAIVAIVSSVRRVLRRMLRSTSLNQLNIVVSDRAQRLRDRDSRGAPCGQQSADRADCKSRYQPRDERACGQTKSENKLADVHQLAAEAGRIRDDDSEQFAQDAARYREHDTLYHETREHVEAAESQHSQHAYLTGPARDRGVHRVHRAEYRADRENQ